MKVSKARSKKDMRSIKKVFMHKKCESSCCTINLLTRDDKDISEIHKPIKEGWEKITVKIDSGAIDSCPPVDMGSGFKTHESKMSREGTRYRDANGTSIKNFGEKHLKGWTHEESHSPSRLK